MALKCVAGQRQDMHGKHGLRQNRLASSARVVACAGMQVGKWERRLEDATWHLEGRWPRHDKGLTRGEQRIMGWNGCLAVERLVTITRMSLMDAGS